MLETLVIAVVAILVFGNRLPEVAVRCVRWIQGVRGSLDQLRRETGLDEEIRSVQRSVREIKQEVSIENPMKLPPEPRRERGPRTGETPGPPVEPKAEPGPTAD